MILDVEAARGAVVEAKIKLEAARAYAEAYPDDRYAGEEIALREEIHDRAIRVYCEALEGMTS